MDLGAEITALKQRVAELEEQKPAIEIPAKPKVKRAPSPYNLFMQKRCAELKKENPDMKLPQLSKMIAAEWKEKKASA
tara:strand:- start:1549 stop:1782 length:234 start_codon:yes stop_codon:yes gene_type:complete